MFTLTNVLTFFHVLCAIVGFGWVLLVGMQFRRAGELKGREGAELYWSANKVTGIAAVFIYLTGAFGLASAITIEDIFKQPWLSISMVVYVVAIAVLLGLLRPAQHKLGRLYGQAVQSESAEVSAEIDRTNKRAAAAGGILDLCFVVMLFLMIFKWPK